MTLLPACLVLLVLSMPFGLARCDAPQAPANNPRPLKVGDPAPPFKAGAWIKGTPVTSLAKGRVYVVEFWATWCGPCRQTIPHLSDLSRKFSNKVTFLGVNVWERGADENTITKQVEDFVKSMGKQMEYRVCRDTPDNHMATAWMQAARRTSIPCAFVVDPNGTVAWIGHPMNNLDSVLEKILGGKFDMLASAAQAEMEAERQSEESRRYDAVQKALAEVLPAIEAAHTSKAWGKVLFLADAAEAKHPELRDALMRYRFQALANTDEAKAKALVDTATVNPTVKSCLIMAEALLDHQSPKSYAPKALELVEKAISLQPSVAQDLLVHRFVALYRSDEAKALTLFEQLKDKPESLRCAYALAWEQDVSKPWGERALAIAESASRQPGANPAQLEPLARLYFRTGRPKEAVSAQKQLLEFLTSQNAPAAFKAPYEADLKTYQNAASR